MSVPLPVRLSVCTIVLCQNTPAGITISPPMNCSRTLALPIKTRTVQKLERVNTASGIKVAQVLFLLSCNIRFVWIFATVLCRRRSKRQWPVGWSKSTISVLSVTVYSEPSEMRSTIIISSFNKPYIDDLEMTLNGHLS